ncbi:MAG: CHASE3 domain-containing protein [Nonlabens sp.]
MTTNRNPGIQNFVYLIASLLVLVALTLFSFFQKSGASEWVTLTWNATSNVRALQTTITEAESGQRGYLLTESTEYLKPYTEARIKYGNTLRKSRDLSCSSPSQLLRLQMIDSLARLKFDELERTVKLVKSGNKSGAMKIVLTDAGKKYMEEMDQQFDQFIDDENELLAQRLDDLSWWKSIVLVCIVATALLVFLSLYTLLKRTRPVFKELVRTKTELQTANAELSQLLNRSKLLNKEKEVSLKENNLLIKSLRGKNKQLDHFAYVASHDLQEPLRTVTNYIQIFEEDYGEKLDDAAAVYFEYVNGAVDRMRKLISGLLTYSRLGTSGNILEVDLNEVVHNIKRDLERKMVELNAQVAFTNLPTIHGHRTELNQLFQNLILNSIKFHRPNVPPHIWIECMATDDYYQISVRDNGIGIKEKDFKKVFDMFKRLHSSNQYQGQGIGLAFCKKIVELHHGKIWLDSVYGEGTTIHFTIKDLKP